MRSFKKGNKYVPSDPRVTQRTRGSITSALIISYLCFTAVIAVAALLLLVVGFLRIRSNYGRIYPKEMRSYYDTMEREDYEDLASEQIFGSGGGIAVYDADMNAVYRNGESFALALTREDVAFIPEYSGINFTNASNSRTVDAPDGGEVTYVTFGRLDPEGALTDGLYILDAEGSVIYTTEKDAPASLSKKQLSLLCDSMIYDYSLSKHEFITDSGQWRCALIFISRNLGIVYARRLVRIVVDTLILFFVAYSVVTAVFVYLMHGTVKRPLDLIGEALVRRTDGSDIPPLIEYSGAREFVDICDRFNDLSTRLRNIEAEREMLLRDKTEILADISHDLKTPITVITGYTKALTDGVVPPEERDEILGTIQRKAEGINELINAFHEYSRLDHPGYFMELEETDICVYLLNYMAQKYSDLEASGHELDVDVPEQRILCDVDKMQLCRAFDNIIGNSVKHGSGGTTVWCTLERRGGSVRIILADNGPGIPPELQSSIFDPFAVGEKSRGGEGSGLGLAICRKIIEAHGGKIRLQSDKERDKRYSTAFEITLPIRNIFPAQSHGRKGTVRDFS